MNVQAIVNDIKTLPPDKQEEVADFVAFLKSRIGINEKQPPSKKKTVNSDSFIGMWADREDMSDSANWVRELREKEWKR